MDISLPSNWNEKGGGVEKSYYLAKNNNGVCVGYSHLSPSSFSVWAGDNWTDNKTLNASCTSKNEAKLKALEFMRKYPNVTYESGRGIGKLYDEKDRMVSRI